MAGSRICIVTPDAVGPVTNGGIGTHCTNLARLLATLPDAEVTLLFTGPTERESPEHWSAWYREQYGVRYVDLGCVESLIEAPVHAATEALGQSAKVHRWLAPQPFDILFFQDWQGNGFAALQAKCAGLHYRRTWITCTLHSPSQWQRQGMERFPSSRSDLVLEYMERYVLQHADTVLSPSRHMLEWAEENHWILASDRRVIAYPFFSPERMAEPRPFDGHTLVFFGRLETRKGLEVFLDALCDLAPDLRASHRKITLHFLGKIAWTSRGLSTAVIEDTLRPLSDVFDWSLHTEMSQPEAVRFLLDHREALVVAPSLLDNLPFAIIECLDLRLNIIAAATGGIPELFGNQEALFEPRRGPLAAKLRDCLRNGSPTLSIAYSAQASNTAWAAFAKSEFGAPRPDPEVPPPRISVCIPHYNYGRYLSALLDSLVAQTYGDFEVVLVDDGSTDPESRRTFRELRSLHSERGWRFFERENEGVGNARNFAASQADGEYLVFMDADNLAKPGMLAVFASAIRYSGADCLTCHLCAFETEDDLAAGKFHHISLPAGACLEGGISCNIFGDANFILRKSVFEALGGFREVRGVTCEDWEFLARLCLEGYSLDVIPEFLFHYRHHADSRTGATHRYRNGHYVLSTYANKLPDWASRYILASLGINEKINDPAFRDRIQNLKNNVKKLKDEKAVLRQRVKSLEDRRKLSYRLRKLFGLTR